MFSRTIENTIREKINGGKAIVVVGARQVGKTTLLSEFLKDKDYLFLDADDPATRNLLQGPTTEQIRTIIGDYRYIFLDEAQRIPGIEIKLYRGYPSSQSSKLPSKSGSYHTIHHGCRNV